MKVNIIYDINKNIEVVTKNPRMILVQTDKIESGFLEGGGITIHPKTKKELYFKLDLFEGTKEQQQKAPTFIRKALDKVHESLK